MELAIDTTFDVRTDSGGKDPDSHSATLRAYHRLLWSKRLPDGRMFDLDSKLRHVSEIGDFWLSSDAIVHTYLKRTWPRQLAELVAQVEPSEATAFYDLACTVGSFLVFPYPRRVDGRWKWSINQARGVNRKIADRFDLTLECIRRLYVGEQSPLTYYLELYQDFFNLFGDFRGYVNFFLLHDLVTPDMTSVCFLTDFDDFRREPLFGGNLEEYYQYMSRSIEFATARNMRISDYAWTLANK